MSYSITVDITKRTNIIMEKKKTRNGDYPLGVFGVGYVFNA